MGRRKTTPDAAVGSTSAVEPITDVEPTSAETVPDVPLCRVCGSVDGGKFEYTLHSSYWLGTLDGVALIPYPVDWNVMEWLGLECDTRPIPHPVPVNTVPVRLSPCAEPKSVGVDVFKLEKAV